MQTNEDFSKWTDHDKYKMFERRVMHNCRKKCKMQKINACRPRWHFPWTKLDCQIGTGWQMYILVGQSMHILCLYASQPTFETLQINDYIPQCPFSNVSNIFNQLSFFNIWWFLVNGLTILKTCIYDISYYLTLKLNTNLKIFLCTSEICRKVPT